MKASLRYVRLVTLFISGVLMAANAAPNAIVNAQTDAQKSQTSSADGSSTGELGKKIEALTRAPSNGIAEIAKMVEQGVESSVIQSYVENSSVPYNPSATDILYLHQHAVPSKIITLAIKRGSEVRAQMAKAYQENQNRPAVTMPAQPAPSAPTVTTAPVIQPAVAPYYYNYVQPVYVPVTYPVYSYSYALPTYSLYSYYAYRPSYSYCYSPSRFSSHFPTRRVGIGVSIGNCSPRISVGASFGHGRGGRFSARIH